MITKKQQQLKDKRRKQQRRNNNGANIPKNEMEMLRLFSGKTLKKERKNG